MQIGDHIVAKVEKLVYGGKGLIRHEGWVIFVADVIAGEVVEVELLAKKKSYFEARLLKVINPSELRVEPPCPYFGICGGCQLQHMAYSEQLRVKREWLIDALRLPSSIDVKVHPSEKEWFYRRKVILHGKECGFYARDNETILPIERCLIFSEKGFQEIRAHAHSDRVTVIRDDNDTFEVTKGVQEKVVEGLQIYYTSAVFTQNNPEQALHIYKDVIAELAPMPTLELYCGIGILSLLASKKVEKLLGVELNAESIELAKKSQAANGIKNVVFKAKASEKLTDRECSGYNQWIVNPPRVGLSGKVLDLVSRHKPEKLIYISCNPATLARDYKTLQASGYSIKKAEVYDMFAQTSHLETVVYFARSN